ncbi:hypothetical protein NC651_002063 [Populus alba x Populus x berolinensis]|nr:hypothetical protein NC651_002063 [Populus alba x Populus x berolinensis]
MVAVSEFSGGAMESYGLVIYRENELLHNVLQPAAARKQRAKFVIQPFSLDPCFLPLLPRKWKFYSPFYISSS